VLAVQISRHGGPEELVPVELPDPVAAEGQVVVRNRWIGVDYVDLQHREGQPYPVGLPLIPGTEAAGTVVATGPGVGPGLAGGVPLDAAAAVAMNGTTAYVLTSMAGRIGPGDAVVVQAASRTVTGKVLLQA
jgi:NADPH:quinone reductase